MSKTWFISDTHFGHNNIIKFTDKDGNRTRPFDSIEEHDEMIIQNVNKVVRPEDRLYVMGDVAMKRKDIQQVGKLNGRKKLIKGNHDIFKLEDYTPYFDDIVACRVYPEQGFIFTHIPIHPSNLEHRFKFNMHGHLHQNVVNNDLRYMNLCLEHTFMQPVDFNEIEARAAERLVIMQLMQDSLISA